MGRELPLLDGWLTAPRTWAWDNLDGFRVQIDERSDSKLVVLVWYDNARTWRAVKDTIEEAIDTAHRIIGEQTIVVAIIDPEMTYD